MPNIKSFKYINDVFIRITKEQTDRYKQAIKRNEFRTLKIGLTKNFRIFYNKFNALRPYLNPSLRDNDKELIEALRERRNKTYLDDIRGTYLPTLGKIVDYLRILEVSYIRKRQYQAARLNNKPPRQGGATSTPKGTGPYIPTLEDTNRRIKEDYDQAKLGQIFKLLI